MIFQKNPDFCPDTRNPEPKTNPVRNPELKIFDPEPQFPGRLAKSGKNPARRPSLEVTPKLRHILASESTYSFVESCLEYCYVFCMHTLARVWFNFPLISSSEGSKKIHLYRRYIYSYIKTWKSIIFPQVRISVNRKRASKTTPVGLERGACSSTKHSAVLRNHMGRKNSPSSKVHNSLPAIKVKFQNFTINILHVLYIWDLYF